MALITNSSINSYTFHSDSQYAAQCKPLHDKYRPTIEADIFLWQTSHFLLTGETFRDVYFHSLAINVSEHELIEFSRIQR